MAIESVTSKIQGQQIFEQGVDLKLADAQTAKTTAPILGGESVKVTDGSMTDLEKLVARLKNESETTRQSVAERRAAILSTVLDSLADRITEAEKENILKIEELNAEKTAAMKDLDGFKSSKAVLESLIESLDRQIEQAVKDGAEHREQVEKLKERRAEEQAKLDRIDASIQSISSKVAGIDVKIAECTKAIAASTLSEVSAGEKRRPRPGVAYQCCAGQDRRPDPRGARRSADQSRRVKPNKAIGASASGLWGQTP